MSKICKSGHISEFELSVCICVTVFAVVCFLCICMQACVALREDKRLDCDKYLVPCELCASLSLMDEVASGWHEMKMQGRKG